MPIPFSTYVSINSGVGGNNAVRQRDLITRIFTENPLVPTGGFIEFQNNNDSAANVGAYFGTSSDEYLRAQFYFGWISKNQTAPQKISFARWTNAAAAPMIYGDETVTQALANWTSITSGSFTLQIGTNTFTLSGINFSSDGSLSAVAATIQAAIRAEFAGGTVWTSATVSYDPTRGTFQFAGGLTGAAGSPIVVTAGTGGSDIAAQLGWLGVNTILSNGSDAETITQTLTNSATKSNNFFSIYFIPSLSTQNIIDIATWVDASNVEYMSLIPVAPADATTDATAVGLLSGTAFTISPTVSQYPEMIPGMVAAATDYTARASVQNFMFQIFPGLTASVTDGVTAAAYDAIRMNYYGNTQTAGQVLNFYQRGTLTGASSDPVDQNVYTNEAWLKDAAGAAIMSLLLSLAVVSANKSGLLWSQRPCSL